MLLRAKGKGVHVDTAVRGTGVVLEGLHNVEVRTLTLGEAVLAVKLELGSDHRVLTPAVHVKGRLSQHEGTGIRQHGAEISNGVTKLVTSSNTRGIVISGTRHLEKTRSVHELIDTRDGSRSTEGMDGVGEGINGISVVEGLGTKGLEQEGVSLKGRAVVDVGIRLNNPHQLLAGVVEIELDLVGRRTDRLVTSELELLNQVLMGVLGHLAALISVEEDVVNIEGSSHEGLLVSSGNSLGTGTQSRHGPQALTNGAEINVDLHLVVLKGNQGKGKSGVAAKPEKKRHVKGGLRKSLAGSAHLGRSSGSAGARHISEGGVSDVGKLGGVTDHLVVTRLLLLGKSKLVPDVHPVTVLAVNALTSNLHLNLGNQLLTNKI